MSNYKYGNWYCKPETEAEAREILERAVASGAKAGETLEHYHWNGYGAWGVCQGCTHTQTVIFCRNHGITEYTIEQVRELFPLPGEKVCRRYAPLHTERGRWVYEAQKHCTEFGSNQLGKLYDALKSGDLKAPEVIAQPGKK